MLIEMFTIDDVKNSEGKLFVFNENNHHLGKNDMYVIRDLPNTSGIRTKVGPSRNSAAFLTDDDYENNLKNIIEDIVKIKSLAISNNLTIVLHSGGYGNGSNDLYRRAPKTYESLCNQLKLHFDFDNKTGKISFEIPKANDFEYSKNISLYERDSNDIIGDINYDLIKDSKRLTFLNKIGYKEKDILVFSFDNGKRIACMVIASFSIETISEDIFIGFEGFSNKGLSGYQSHFKYLCEINEKNELIFDNDLIFNNHIEAEEEAEEEVIKKTMWGRLIKNIR